MQPKCNPMLWAGPIFYKMAWIVGALWLVNYPPGSFQARTKCFIRMLRLVGQEFRLG